MSFLKCPKLWAYLVLLASLAFIGTILYAIAGVRLGWESMNFRAATTLIGQTMDIGVWVSIAPVLALAYSLVKKQIHSSIVSVAALLIIAVPLGINNASQPEPNQGGARVQPLNEISTDSENPPL